MIKMQKWRFRATLVVATLIASSAFAQDSVEDAKATAVDAHHSCLRQQAARLDDGVSSAETVGKAIAPLCEDYLQATAVYFGPFRSKRSEKMFRAMLTKRAPETATIIVLEGRKKGESQ